MMMELDILLKSVSVVRVTGDTVRNITGINMDSRLVQAICLSPSKGRRPTVTLISARQ